MTEPPSNPLNDHRLSIKAFASISGYSRQWLWILSKQHVGPVLITTYTQAGAPRHHYNAFFALKWLLDQRPERVNAYLRALEAADPSIDWRAGL
ncbi:hypothetical protein [Ensifer sp. MJa1]|uniref:hypothetical protein n=1 Tax=Ensifer sp. MJa1 TaxID=2919888 RepID=UPI003009CE0E